jgi:hypothetical protein
MAQTTMRIQHFITEHLEKRLDDCKALVVYDPDHLYRDIVHGMAGDPIHVVDGTDSTIAGRVRCADVAKEKPRSLNKASILQHKPMVKGGTG